ncbi:hypothetical protein [Acinetobacter sp. MD2(2019)]|uniref:hypothetical protein n=1 Tax=Acinetobacter sp. MD2(2019) TaxID=2605273 RepID=UPI002D1EED1E|nr:hypothetical protein [Acinetobacter sp. MD2(2019)]MEB3753805.1 hypothetical protein [Acinetobacter sp. MD2(2019)]
MQNLISTNAAFEAMLAGKKVLCRDATSTLLKEFRPISEFSADIFARSNTEFTIEIEMIELAGCSFPKPLFLSDIQVGQEIFIVMPACILRTKFDAENKDVNKAIIRGFAQPDADSAIDQARAISLSLGIDLVRSAFEFIQDVAAEKPVKRGKKLAKLENEVIVAPEDRCSLIIDALATCNSLDEVGAMVADLGQSDFTTDQWQRICDAKDAALKSLSPKQPDVAEDPNAPSQKLKDRFMEQLSAATCIQDVEACEEEIKGNTQLIENHRYHLATFVGSRKAVFVVREYESKLADLLVRVQDSQTAGEVNAITRYTKDWTEKQREPLIAAQSKRLSELNQTENQNPPSLLADIQNATTAEALDTLEAAAYKRNPEIVPTLLDEIKKKRAALNSQQEGDAA